VAPVDGEPFDLSQIDFDALRHQFEQRQKNTEAAKLRGRLNVKAKEMTRLNQSRIDFLKKLQALIDDYNAGRIDVDLFFEKLMAFAKELQEEDQRAMVERLTEEELALFDILLKPAPELTKEEVAAVKKVAQELLATLKKQKLVLDWRKRQRTRAAVQMTIEDWLEQLPASYDDDLWDKKVDMVYSHVYDNYYGAGNSLYAYVS
jgi:type I restriction enzyme R subunit